MTARPGTLGALLMAPGSYWRVSRAHRYSLVYAIPLLLLYETLAALLSYDGGGGVRNGADVIIKSAFGAMAGQYGQLLFALTVLCASVWLIGRDMRAHGHRLRASVFVKMGVESVALALVFGVVVGTLTARILSPFAGLAGADPLGGAESALALVEPPLVGAVPAQLESLGWWTTLMVSLGAGIYEELLFRVILVSALAFAANRVLGLRPLPAGVTAVIVGAIIFSAFHYIGPYADPWRLDSFTFRMIGGIVFSAMYLLRGFGITAWTHALYDVFLLLT
jgi:hypothetical protein